MTNATIGNARDRRPKTEVRQTWMANSIESVYKQTQTQAESEGASVEDRGREGVAVGVVVSVVGGVVVGGREYVEPGVEEDVAKCRAEDRMKDSVEGRTEEDRVEEKESEDRVEDGVVK